MSMINSNADHLEIREDLSALSKCAARVVYMTILYVQLCHECEHVLTVKSCKSIE